MSTTSLTAGQVMDRVAALMNDPARTDYTYEAQLIYLNMAVDELVENLEQANASPTNQTSTVIVVPLGANSLYPVEHPDGPHYPYDLIEIQEVAERLSGTTNQFTGLCRREWVGHFPPCDSLMFWTWEDQCIKFNPSGASTARDVQLRYVRQPIQQAQNENSLIGTIGTRSYLAYKTAGLCALFIGENPSRAQTLEQKAEESMDRLLGINTKGSQQIVTRRKPFRSSYKSRGWY